MTKKIKLAFLMNHLVMGGVVKALCRFLPELQRCGLFECTVISYAHMTENWVSDFLSNHGVHLIEVEGLSPIDKKAFFLIKWYKKARRHREKRRISNNLNRILPEFDILVDFSNCSFCDYIQTNTIKIGWVHGGAQFFNQCLAKKNLKKYDRIVLLTDSLRMTVEKQNPELAGTLMHIYNYLDVDNIRRQAAQSDYVVNGPYFVAVQRLDSDKSVRTIIKAFERFWGQHQDYRLYIVGDGPQMDYLKSLSQNEAIVFTGQLNNPYPIIKNASALILSSTLSVGEGLGYVLLEAQALDVLCISSDVKSGPSEVLKDGKAGLLFDPESEESLFASMCRAVEDKEMAEAMRREAAIGLERFSANNTIYRFILEMKKLVSDSV